MIIFWVGIFRGRGNFPWSSLMDKNFPGGDFLEPFDLFEILLQPFFIKQRCLSKVRGSRPEEFCKKGVLRNFSNFTGKHLCQSLFFQSRLRFGFNYKLKKQSPKSVLERNCFEKVHKSLKKTPELECFLNKVAGCRNSNTGAVLQVLRNASEQLLYRIPVNGYY